MSWIDEVLKIFKPLEAYTNEFYDKNYLLYAATGLIVLFFIWLIYVIFF